jgi:hypothetical protein
MKMRILCTHPGRFGDLLWALPTVRALSESFKTTVDLLLSPSYSPEPLLRLIASQPYIGSVWVANDWLILETAPITPRQPPSVPSGYDRIIHLGYESWPSLSLPWEMCGLAEKQVPLLAGTFDLDRPWITSSFTLSCDVAVGFSDEYFEMKYGLERLLWEHLTLNGKEATRRVVNVSGGPRWHTQNPWGMAAAWIGGATLFVGCCSALHVLACAMGVPVILVEPQPARHHDVFYPYGKLGPQVLLLTGNDGLPTFDARHLCDAVDAQLREEATV